MVDDGGPAFPMVNELGVIHHSGMSLRDWYAGMALWGQLGRVGFSPDAAAKFAYDYADAMLVERKK